MLLLRSNRSILGPQRTTVVHQGTLGLMILKTPRKFGPAA
jgi:hypothetical protein